MSTAVISHTRGPHRQAALVSLGLAVLLFAGMGVAHARVCRVTTNATGSGHGSNWAVQAMTLKAALADTDCSEIWVAAGVYMPVRPAIAGAPTTAERKFSFKVLRNVQVYGGFAGNETTRSQRDPAAHPTILSGDIDHNDSNADSNNIAETTSDIQGDNSYHVVYLDGAQGTPITGSTVLDGFTITAGHADGASDDSGGGLYCDGHYGGHECSPSLSNITFSGNSAHSRGGAMFNDGLNGGTSSPTLNEVTFSGNSAGTWGGAMYNYGASGTSSPTLSDITFSGNSADYGGAMYNFGVGGTSSPSLSNITFSDNSAGKMGGAMFNDGYLGTSSPTLSNVTFSGNSAVNYGGAMFNVTSNRDTGSAALSNIIAWGNTAFRGAEIYNDVSGDGATPTIEHSVIQGSGGSGGSWDADLGIDAGGNLDADPNLGSLGDNGGFTHTMLPRVGSSAINATPCSGSPAADQRGAPRPDPGSIDLPFRCDIGAVEAHSPAGDVIFANGFD